MFDRSQNVFPSNAHRLARYLGAGRLPFVGVAPIQSDSQSARQLLEGEKLLHESYGALGRQGLKVVADKDSATIEIHSDHIPIFSPL